MHLHRARQEPTSHLPEKHRASEMPAATAQGAGQNSHSQASCSVRNVLKGMLAVSVLMKQHAQFHYA